MWMWMYVLEHFFTADRSALADGRVAAGLYFRHSILHDFRLSIIPHFHKEFVWSHIAQLCQWVLHSIRASRSWNLRRHVPPCLNGIAIRRLCYKLFNCLRNLAPSYPVTWWTCVIQLQATFIDAVCVRLCVAASSFHRRRQSFMVHAALLSLGRQREMRYLHHYATTNSLLCHFVASWRLNYTLEHFELPSVQLARRRKLFLDKFCVCV